VPGFLRSYSEWRNGGHRARQFEEYEMWRTSLRRFLVLFRCAEIDV
jgi:hypothetical protein